MKVVLFCLIGLFSSPLWSQQYNFITYGVIDGLAQSQVTDICQDKLGDLWIGTQSGLSRYNSQTFVNYSIDDGLADNVISHIIISKENILWVVTPSGLSKFENGKFKSFFFSESIRINSIVEVDGLFLLASNYGIISFDGQIFSDKYKPVEPINRIRSLEMLYDSIVLVGTSDGMFELVNNQLKSFPLKGLNGINVMDAKVRDNELIIATRYAGIIAYNLKANLYTSYPVDGIPVTNLFVDAASIWASSNFGVVEIRNGKTNYYTEENGLSINSIKTVDKDMEGNLWIGTYGKGLLKFSGNAIVSYTTKEGLSSDIVMSISQFGDGSFGFGTYDKGFSRFTDRNTNQKFDSRSGLNHNSVWATYVDYNDFCWLGTSGGLECLKDGVPVLEKLTNQINQKIRSICQSSDSSLFLGGAEGLWMIKDDSLTFLESTVEFNIYKVEVSKVGVFLATWSGLYWQSHDSINEPFNKITIPEENINTLAIDHYNNIWVGSINGLYLVSPQLDVKLVELDKGNYQSKNIMGIIKDRQNRMWVSTTHGLFMVNGTNQFNGLSAFYQYTLSEGLVDLESNLNALFEDKEGFIWMGTSTALSKINPVLNPVLFSYNLPTLSITGVRLFKESFSYADYKVGELMGNGTPTALEFPYTKNHLTFDFIGINNKNPDKVFYTYRLLGAEEKWSPLTKENSASYSFIKPGTYEFQVKSANKNLEWTEPVIVKIVINSPFWQKWWFILIIGLALFSLGYYILQSRISGIKQKKDNERLVSESKLRNLEQQSLNASMNRHFIFNSLNSIQYFINSSDKKSANKYLSNFAQLIRKNLDSSTQHNFLVSLNEEIERINLYLSLEKMRFSEKFDFIVKVDEEIDSEMIQVPSMILQPFVENSIIHGVLPKQEKGLISIIIKEEGDFIIFEVLDDGVGIDSSLNTKDGFKGDHKSQGMEITANRIDLLRTINGDKLMIIGPFQINKDGKSVGTKVIIKLPLY
ncbi:MAG: two-component regulator propeller domain-containing protein [Crocinitomicaceae bacterium]